MKWTTILGFLCLACAVCAQIPASFQENGTSYINLRLFCDWLGAAVKHKGNSISIILPAQQQVILPHDSCRIIGNGKAMALSIALATGVLWPEDGANIIPPPGQIFVPARVVANGLGLTVVWVPPIARGGAAAGEPTASGRLSGECGR